VTEGADTLYVWHEQQCLGLLWRDELNRLGFRYTEEWLDHGGFPVSQSLPLTAEPFLPEHSTAHRFFVNLLPEGAVREQIVRDLKLPQTDFDLLRAIGGECAGALSILPGRRKPSTNHHYRALNDDDLSDLIARRGQIYGPWPGNDRPRLSLAGAQNKCPVLLRDRRYWLPREEAPSSHILKFELADYRHVPLYETFTTWLARAIGLPTVDIALRIVDRTEFAEVKRFDRIPTNENRIQRLHQEDFCQALGLGHTQKYQDHGGPSFAQCYRLLMDVSHEPAIDGQHLLRWQIFNVLAGNSDGHAKNLALLYTSDGAVRLAPFYDLVCTRAIDRVDHHLAFDVGGERRPGAVEQERWRGLAQQCDVQARYLIRLVGETATQLLDHLTSTRNKFEEHFGPHPALQRTERIVRKQCRRAKIN